MLCVRYSCPACGLERVEVLVRCRESGEDVVHWMDAVVVPALGADHHARHPWCVPRVLRNVEIPAPVGTGWLGGPVVQ